MLEYEELKMHFKKLVLVVLSLFLFSSDLFGLDDICKNNGLVVLNSDFKHLWYIKNDITCTIWKKNKLITISEGDTLSIYSDSNCKNKSCELPENVTIYEHFRAFDTNNNCRIKLYSRCNLSDM